MGVGSWGGFISSPPRVIRSSVSYPRSNSSYTRSTNKSSNGSGKRIEVRDVGQPSDEFYRVINKPVYELHLQKVKKIKILLNTDMEKEDEKTENVGNMFGSKETKPKVGFFKRILNFFKNLF